MNKNKLFFLDSKTCLYSLSLVNRDFSYLSGMAVYTRLYNFCPCLATKDDLVNKLLLALLIKHFPGSATVASPAFIDELELWTLKFNFEPEGCISRTIMYDVLSLLHGIAYDDARRVPSDRDAGTRHFIEKLKVFHLPRCVDYMISRIEDASLVSWLRNLRFMNS